jgi:hypothetical protein
MTDEQRNERNKKRQDAYRKNKEDAANKENKTGSHIRISLNFTHFFNKFHYLSWAAIEQSSSVDKCIGGECMDQTHSTPNSIQPTIASG